MSSGITPLPQQHPRLANTDLPGCIVRQDFHCAVLSDALGQHGVEQCLSFHPNGLAVVQLAPTHPAVGDGDRRGKRVPGLLGARVFAFYSAKNLTSKPSLF